MLIAGTEPITDLVMGRASEAEARFHVSESGSIASICLPRNDAASRWPIRPMRLRRQSPS